MGQCCFTVDSVPDKYKTQRMFYRVLCEDLFLVVYCLDNNITQKMCD